MGFNWCTRLLRNDDVFSFAWFNGALLKAAYA